MMRYCSENCLDMPDDFPDKEFVAFMESARRVLLKPQKGKAWQEFAGASNLISWRYRGSIEYWQAYKDSWTSLGFDITHEENFKRERSLFGMFSSGVACIESTSYALAALLSHPSVLGLKFATKEQKSCNPKNLIAWAKQFPSAKSLVLSLSRLCNSSEWQQWVELRNRMTHRSNLPRIVYGSVGSQPPKAKALQFGSTSSTPLILGELEEFDKLVGWLAASLAELLIEGKGLCPP